MQNPEETCQSVRETSELLAQVPEQQSSVRHDFDGIELQWDETVSTEVSTHTNRVPGAASKIQWLDRLELSTTCCNEKGSQRVGVFQLTAVS